MAIEQVRRNSNCSRYFIKYSRIGENKLIDDPDQDVTYQYFSLGNSINKPQHWSHAKVTLVTC